jgi:hypothetical protein
MKITLDAELLVLNEADLEKVLKKFIRLEMTKAIRRFFKTSLVRIPVRSGFLRGSFRNVADHYNTRFDNFPYNRTTQRYYHTRGTKGLQKTAHSGVRYVTDPDKTMRISSDNSATFTLDNRIRYYEANDVGSTVPGAPWGSAQAGIEAANESLRGADKRFPDIALLLTKIRITSKDGSSRQSKSAPSVESVLSSLELLMGD